MYLFMVLSGGQAPAQISPGPLATVHSHLEGLTNCTKCHDLGNKVTNAKCLACHTDLKSRIDQNKGYHSSSGIRGKNCITCHSDHHGLNFQITRFSKENFNHSMTGFTLTGAHVKKDCKDCHKSEFIADRSAKSRKFTYLGLSTQCIACHTDYHQKTLSSDCSACHGVDAFKPAVKFNHATTRYPLAGMHLNVPCLKCHAVTTKNNVKFQEFAGVKFASCVNCHADVHQNKFGLNCMQCHTVESFHSVKGIANFDHSKTNFKLLDKHLGVACNLCHKNNVTTPLKHDQCKDCHADYHQGQFAVNGVTRDCSGCHDTKGFKGSSFSIEQHNAGNFVLLGAHLATPCFSCHKKQEKWSFRQIGIHCADCHEDIHKDFIDKKYYPGAACEKCHTQERWPAVVYDHSQTRFELTGAHAKQSCRSCHFGKQEVGHETQKFAGLPVTCSGCHRDNHFNQFEQNGITDCQRCHSNETWKIGNFDHNRTAFKLDGKHQNVACAKCHKLKTNGTDTYVFYKIKEWKCENCH